MSIKRTQNSMWSIPYFIVYELKWGTAWKAQQLYNEVFSRNVVQQNRYHFVHIYYLTFSRERYNKTGKILLFFEKCKTKHVIFYDFASKINKTGSILSFLEKGTTKQELFCKIWRKAKQNRYYFVTFREMYTLYNKTWLWFCLGWKLQLDKY